MVGETVQWPLLLAERKYGFAHSSSARRLRTVGSRQLSYYEALTIHSSTVVPHRPAFSQLALLHHLSFFRKMPAS